MNTTFKEEQRFDQWWLWLLLGGVISFLLYGMFMQLIMGQPFGLKPAPDYVLILSFLLMSGIALLFAVIRLRTSIDQEEIHVQFYPILRKTVKWVDIKSAEIVRYRFVGGYGIRILTRYGTVYNTRGHKGLAIVMKNGRKFMVGTQKEEELRRFLKMINQNSNIHQ